MLDTQALISDLNALGLGSIVLQSPEDFDKLPKLNKPKREIRRIPDSIQTVEQLLQRYSPK